MWGVRKAPCGAPVRLSTSSSTVKKSIYSLIDLFDILLGCNRRYLAHLSALDDFSAGVRALDRVTRPREVHGKTVKGINFFKPGDGALLPALQNPRVNIAGVRRADLLTGLEMFSPTRLYQATAPIAGYRRDQAGHRNLSVLSDEGRTCRYRSGGAAHRGDHHSGYDLMGFYAERGNSWVIRD